jgi:hypothetical protein
MLSWDLGGTSNHNRNRGANIEKNTVFILDFLGERAILLVWRRLGNYFLVRNRKKEFGRRRRKGFLLMGYGYG